MYSKPNNKNAAKPATRRASAWLQVRCRPADKARWETKAKAAKVSVGQWVRSTLNQYS